MRSLHCMALMAGLLATSAVTADMKTVTLRTNPFLQPVILSEGQNDGTNTEDSVIAEMELRATMVAGRQSQANIGGVIIGLGEVVNGYRLDEVHARHVVLDRDGTRKELRIDDSDRTNRD